MKQKKKTLSLVFLSVILVIFALSGCSAPKKATKEGSGSSSSSNEKQAYDIDTSNDTVKVGLLHSLSGTMAISEVTVKNAEMMAIDEINKQGGLLGKKIKPVVEDGASDWPTFAEKAKKLLMNDHVATIFGGWTSASRKAMLPVMEQYKGLLWYPVQYEGMEQSPNIAYTGATTNQQIVPAVDWILENKGKKVFLVGSDYVFPRTANKIIKAQLKAKGGETVGEEYTPLGSTNYTTIISKIKRAKPDVIFNTLNGDSNVALFKQLKDAGITSKDIPVLSVSIAEEEVKGIDPALLAGHYASWNYYQSTNTPENTEFVKAYKAKYGDDKVTSDPMESAYTAVHIWAEAVKKAKSFDVDKVKSAAKDLEYNSPGGTVKFDGETQHLYKVVRIGEVQKNGQFKEVWNSGDAVKPDPYLKTYDWAKGLSASSK